MCQIGLETPNVQNEHYQTAARGPFKYVGPGPSAPHFENVHFEKTYGGRRPLVYIGQVNLFT